MWQSWLPLYIKREQVVVTMSGRDISLKGLNLSVLKTHAVAQPGRHHVARSPIK